MPKFAKGHPGGPGRPKGSRNKARAKFDEIAREDSVVEAIRAFSASAAQGDSAAARILFEIFWPAPRRK